MKQFLQSAAWNVKFLFSCYFNILIIFLLFVTNIVYSQQLPNPIRYYPLDNGNTNEIINNKNGIAHGTIPGVTDRFGNSTGASDLYRNSTSSQSCYIETPSFFEGTDISSGKYSVTFWAYVRDASNIPDENFFFAASGSVITRKRLFALEFTNQSSKTSGGMQITRYIPSNITKTDTKEFPYWLWSPTTSQYCKGVWTFFAISLTKQGTRVYMKSKDKSTEWATNYFPSQDLTAATFWGIGEYGGLETTLRKSVDYIDDFKVYADELNINQVEQLYNMEKPNGGTWGVYRLKNVKSGTYLTADYGVDSGTDKDAMIKHEDRAGATYLWKINFPNNNGADYIQWLGEYGNQKSLNIYQNRTSDNAEVGTWGAWQDNAKWYFLRQSDGSYQIKNYYTSTWLATDNGTVGEDVLVRARTSPQTDGSGNWIIEEVNLKPFEQDYYRFQNKKSGHYFSQGDLTFFARPASPREFEFRAQQRTEDASGCKNIWELQPVAHNNDRWRSYKLKNINEGGTYWWNTGPSGWMDWANAGNYLVPREWSWDDGTLLVTGDDKGADEGQYVFWKDTKGAFRIANLKHMKFCVVENGSGASGAYIKQYGSGSDNAQWGNFEKIKFLYSKEDCDRNFYIKNVKTSNYLASNIGTEFENLYDTDKSGANIFKMRKDQYPSLKYPRSVQIYKMIGGKEWKAWDLNHYYIGDNSSIGVYPSDGENREDKTNQDWYVYTDSKGYQRIASAYSMKYSRLVSDGGKYWLENCCDNDNIDGGLNQWTFQDVKDTDTNNVTGKRNIEKTSTQNNEFRIFPNPITNNISVSFLLDTDDMIKFDLFDLNGKIIYSKKQNFLKGQQNASLELNISSNIVYILRITKSNGELIGSQKIIKK